MHGTFAKPPFNVPTNYLNRMRRSLRLEGGLLHQLRATMNADRTGFPLHLLLVSDDDFEIVTKAGGQAVAHSADFCDDRVFLHRFQARNKSADTPKYFTRMPTWLSVNCRSSRRTIAPRVR